MRLEAMRLSGCKGLTFFCTLNVKFTLATGHEGPEREYRYVSTISLTSVLDGGGLSMPCPDRFIPWKDSRYPL